MTEQFTIEKEDAREIKDLMVVGSPELILIILHEKKKEILKLLFEKGHTIQELKNLTGINPGTIKRHLNQLEENNLVFVQYIKKNSYNIKMKYYRATAKHIKISIELP